MEIKDESIIHSLSQSTTLCLRSVVLGLKVSSLHDVCRQGGPRVRLWKHGSDDLTVNDIIINTLVRKKETKQNVL